MNGCIRQTVGPVIEERVQERKVLKNMLMELEEAENGWKCQYIIIINFFTVALSMDLILSITKNSAKQDKPTKLSVFSLFLQFSSVLLICLPSLILLFLPHLPQQVRQPSRATLLFKCSPYCLF